MLLHVHFWLIYYLHEQLYCLHCKQRSSWHTLSYASLSIYMQRTWYPRLNAKLLRISFFQLRKLFTRMTTIVNEKKTWSPGMNWPLACLSLYIFCIHCITIDCISIGRWLLRSSVFAHTISQRCLDRFS